jgi:hypothetical protein
MFDLDLFVGHGFLPDYEGRVSGLPLGQSREKIEGRNDAAP